MNKNEFEIGKLSIQAGVTGKLMELVSRLATVGAVVFSIYLIVQGLTEMVKAKPEALMALSTVIEKLKINQILGYVVAAGTSAAWMYERQGKKRAIKKSDALRKKLENKDAYSPSSNLDENGHTPQ